MTRLRDDSHAQQFFLAFPTTLKYSAARFHSGLTSTEPCERASRVSLDPKSSRLRQPLIVSEGDSATQPEMQTANRQGLLLASSSRLNLSQGHYAVHHVQPFPSSGERL
jgi:hypothetical protein